MIKVLAIDDDSDFCHSMKRITERMDLNFSSVPSIKDALKSVSEDEYDLILLDVGLPDGNGIDILPSLKEQPSMPEVIILTGEGDPEGAELAILNGAWDYLEKTASTKKISLTITRVLQYREERRKANELSSVKVLRREGIIGSSPAIKKSLNLVAKAAGTDANVLITGETGTGKELFAKSVHNNSSRADKEFVTIDCASIPENLAENLLFGHKKGVYTGADVSSSGLIEMANKGTLFLDEIGELSLSLQKTFLRVLQEKKYRPLGEKKEIESDFRLVAATNKDLDKMVAEGKFRSDLLFRIRSFHIKLPNLSQRSGDIKKLARFYLDYFCEQQMVDSKGVSADFVEAIEKYEWKGNVRELANTMEHVVIEALNEPSVFSKHLPGSVRVHIARSKLKGRKGKENDGGYSIDNMPELSEYRDHITGIYEKKYLRDLLRNTKDLKDALNVSGLSRSRLYALLKKHGLKGNDKVSKEDLNQ